MRVVESRFEILTPIDGDQILKHIELCGRVCYKSEDKITPDSAKKFIANIIQRGHESVLEHLNITVRIICDRGVSHEIVRHRLASYSQSSTRYCNYSKDKFSNEITFVKPLFWDESSKEYTYWETAMKICEMAYMALINDGATPQEARSVLPNSLMTELVMTMNLREWRHFFSLRAGSAAHPQMREVVIPLLKEFQKKIPVVFDDIKVAEEVTA